jgi:exonuclease III
MQQVRSLLAHYNNLKTLVSPNPHRQFVLDLQAWIQMLQADGTSIILALDANEDILASNPSYSPLSFNDGIFINAPQHSGSLATLLTTCGLVDTLSHLHPPPYPSTYHRGVTRLDYILMSKELLPTLLRGGVLPLHSVFIGDHCPCYIDLDAATLFGKTTYPIATHSQRGIQLMDRVR